MNCDEYYSYNALAGLVKTNEEEAVARDPWELVTEAIARMQRNGDVMRSDRLKQVMQEIDSSFDESDLGFSKFSKFTMEAAQKGLLVVSRLENGQLEVAPVAGRAAAPASGGRAPAGGRGQGRTAAATPAPAAAVADGATPSADGEEERPGRPRRGRRGRGGRGREGRDERPGGDVAAQADREAADITPVDFVSPDADTTAAEATPRAERPRGDRARGERPPREAAVERVVVGDSIGESGERLTRDEAFQLVRQAVIALTKDEDDAARASDVRVRARELLGRDSESLGERMFTRILRDAHDADMIDLRRRGDDFEVARAVAAPSVREQLVRAESAASPSNTGNALSTAAAARRGMGPRGVAGRGGRGRPGLAGPPPDLFAVGIIDEPSSAPAPVEADLVIEPEQPAVVAEETAAPSRTRTPAKRARKSAAPASEGDAAERPAAKKTARSNGRKTAAKRAAKAKTDE
jgi:hypothetical protein